MLRAGDRKQRSRDPERTRERLLHAGFQEVYRSGFHSASIDTILAATNVTKGALYHHFDSKEELGHAIIEEIIAKLTRDKWSRPLERARNPINTLIAIVQATSVRPKDVNGGCPLVNLAQEMSALDEQFRKRLATIFHAWQEGIATALQGTGSRNGPRRFGSRRDGRLSDRDVRGLRHAGKECSGCGGVECRDEKHRGMVEISSRTSSIA